MPGSDINWTKLYLYARIVVGAVMLVLQAIGIAVSVSKLTMTETVEKTAQAIKKSSVFQKAIRKFIDVWKKAGSSKMEKAKAIFILLKDTYAAGILGTIIKSLCSSMSKLDWFLTSAKVSAMIIAAFATEGWALIAKIALAVMAANDLAEDIVKAIELG